MDLSLSDLPCLQADAWCKDFIGLGVAVDGAVIGVVDFGFRGDLVGDEAFTGGYGSGIVDYFSTRVEECLGEAWEQ